MVLVWLLFSLVEESTGPQTENCSGNALWHNPLKGFGTGLATIATEHNPGDGNALVLAEKRRRDEAAAASAAVVAAA